MQGVTIVTDKNLIQLVYASSANEAFKEDELLTLLEQARQKNLRLGITGMLLYKGGNFLQVLEGEESVVMNLYATIQSDQRHHQIMTVSKRTIAERTFGEWQMAFVNLHTVKAEDVPGYSAFLDEPFTVMNFVSKPSLATRFLKVFKEGMR